MLFRILTLRYGGSDHGGLVNHRPKRKNVEKGMDVSGENLKECIRQAELDKYSELDSVRTVFRALGLDPQKLDLRLCEQAPPGLPKVTARTG